MMREQTKNMLIGIFVVIACSLTISIIMFLKPKAGDGKQTLYVRFSNINKIGIGTRVTFAGRPIGEVVAINELYDARTQPADASGEFYFYQLVLKIDSTIKVYDTDEISLQTSGLLGEKSIAIIPKAPLPGVIPKLITNQPIYAISTDPIENGFKQVSQVANEIEGTFKRLNGWLDKHQEEVAASINFFGGAMNEIEVAVHSLNQNKLIDAIKMATQNFSCTMQLIGNAVKVMHEESVFKNIGPLVENLKSASYSIDQITQDLAQGTGTLGKLIKGDDLYLRLTAVMSKADILMNDINHYGILFHLNKKWQRIRTKRVDLLNALNTPESFKSYFEVEIDGINTAMSRLSMLVDKASENSEKSEIFKDGLFKKDFAELLQQVDQLSDNLKLYNQQLMEAN